MKTTLRISAGIMLIMALAGCAAQKGGNNTVKSTAEEVLYKQAIQALDERKFIIEATEFYFPGGKPPTVLAGPFSPVPHGPLEYRGRCRRNNERRT